MFRTVILAAAFLCIALSGATVCAQSVEQRTHELVSALDKTKHKVKEKGNIRIELYVDVKNEAVVKSDPST